MLLFSIIPRTQGAFKRFLPNAPKLCKLKAGEDGLASNMFNITPYFPSTQPVFHDIALKIGVIPEILLYTALIALGAWILWFLEYAYMQMPKKRLWRRS